MQDTYRYVVRTTQNNGVRGYIKESKKFLNEKNVLSFAQDTFSVFYQKDEFFTGNKVKILKPKFTNTDEKIMQFFVSCFQKTLEKCSWGLGSTVLSIFDTKFRIPIKDENLGSKIKNIDFEFMENFISELEFYNLFKINDYLIASGLKDYKLNKNEISAIEKFGAIERESKSGLNLKWGEFKLQDLFEILGTKSLDSNAIEFTKTGINFVGRTFENNGIQGKIQKRNFEPNKPFTITTTVIGNYKYVKFQTEPYYCSQNINKLSPKENIRKWNKKIAYFFICNIQKFTSFYGGQQGGYKLDDIKNHTIKLPIINNGEIDFEFMQNFISAIEKLIIKNLVIYVDEKLSVA